MMRTRFSPATANVCRSVPACLSRSYLACPRTANSTTTTVVCLSKRMVNASSSKAAPHRSQQSSGGGTATSAIPTTDAMSWYCRVWEHHLTQRATTTTTAAATTSAQQNENNNIKATNNGHHTVAPPQSQASSRSSLSGQALSSNYAVARHLAKLASRTQSLNDPTASGANAATAASPSEGSSASTREVPMSMFSTDLCAHLWAMYEDASAQSMTSDGATTGKKKRPPPQRRRENQQTANATADVAAADARAHIAWLKGSPLIQFFCHVERLGCVDADAAQRAMATLVPGQRGGGRNVAPTTAATAAQGAAIGPPPPRSPVLSNQQLAKIRLSLTPLYETWWLNATLAMPNGFQHLMSMRHRLMDLQTKVADTTKAIAQSYNAVTAAAAAGQHNSQTPGSAQEQNDDGNAASAVAHMQKVAGFVQQRLSNLDASVTHVLRAWLTSTWLTLEELHWLRTPAAVFEKVVASEAVHPFASLSSASQRCAPVPKRHLYAFFHPALVASPLVMVQVAITRGIAGSVDGLLSPNESHCGAAVVGDTTAGSRQHLLVSAAPSAAALLTSFDDENTPMKRGSTATGSRHVGRDEDAEMAAIFYSISSTQPGLKGIDLGHQLIVAAVAELQRSRPDVRTFSTLSPVPGYSAWLRAQVGKAEGAAKRNPLSLTPRTEAVGRRGGRSMQEIFFPISQSAPSVSLVSVVSDVPAASVSTALRASEEEDAFGIRVFSASSSSSVVAEKMATTATTMSAADTTTASSLDRGCDSGRQTTTTPPTTIAATSSSVDDADDVMATAVRCYRLARRDIERWLSSRNEPEAGGRLAAWLSTLIAHDGFPALHRAAAVREEPSSPVDGRSPAAARQDAEKGTSAGLRVADDHEDGPAAIFIAKILLFYMQHNLLNDVDPARDSLFAPILMRSVAHYLTSQKKRSKPLDPVANFHLGNGAVLHRVMYGANRRGRGGGRNQQEETAAIITATATTTLSPHQPPPFPKAAIGGCEQSGTVMVNYWYDLERTDVRAAAFEMNSSVFVSSSVVAQASLP